MRKVENLINFISTFFRSETNKIILGRWTINYCPISIKKKIDSGNHDHCGTCDMKNLKNSYEEDNEKNDKLITKISKTYSI